MPDREESLLRAVDADVKALQRLRILPGGIASFFLASTLLREAALHDRNEVVHHPTATRLACLVGLQL